jgi:hypothetical protein
MIRSVTVLPRENPHAWRDQRPDDVPAGWIDDMIHRLYEEWNRQMIRMERASKQRSDKKDERGNYVDDPEQQRQDAQTLNGLLRALDKIMQMENGRVTERKISKANSDPESAIAILRRRLDKLLEADRAQCLPEHRQE